ncbi:MAG: hypothetical protein JNL11_16460 [Bdellovibrionaceae bacterium]|nr:hypothetical protein [Pseudobdellovibrionaceae bacterium]
MKWDLDDCEVEVVKVNLKQAEYEDKIVRLVKALLEIDGSLIRADDVDVIEKEAA